MLVGAVLIGVLALQVLAPPRTTPPADSPLAPRRLRMPVAVPAPEYPAIVQNPVFAPDRRPGDVGRAQGLQLIGLAAGGPGGASVVVRGLDGVGHVLRPGESLQGWRFVSVRGDRAVFDGPGGAATLSVDATQPAYSTPSTGASDQAPAEGE
jgi:hypothetical protein